MDPLRKAKSYRAALQIIRRLREQGHVALLAGGCVRDMLLKRSPQDYDVATDAVPDRVCSLFRRTRRVGAQFGVVLVRQVGVWIEVATFRSDSHYEDGRHPVTVTFSDPEQDAKRRDFTINGMFLDPITDEVIDYVDGLSDLRQGVVRTIGEPRDRFAEDHLRLIRAVRFAQRLQYQIEPDTFEAIKEHAPKLQFVSPERIREELERILADLHRADAVRQLAETGLIQHLWTGADWSEERVTLAVDALGALPDHPAPATCLAGLLLPWDTGEVGRICRALRCSNSLRSQVTWLCGHLPDVTAEREPTLADLKLLMHNPLFPELLALGRAILTARGQSTEPVERLAARAKTVPEDQIHPDPFVRGEDLIALGLKPGPVFKDLLDRAYRAQLEGEIRTRSDALAWLRCQV